MRRITVIGYNAYLAHNLEKYLKNIDVIKCSYTDWQERISEIKNSEAIINFSISPLFSQQSMELDDIIDIQIARELKGTKVQYIYMSSRKVYGLTQKLTYHKENDELKGIDFYAQNKIKTETGLQTILKNQLTILRVSNIVGEPILRTGYKTFIGWISENYIKYGKILTTQNIESQKDFITKAYLQQCIAEIIKHRLIGVFNVSAGFPTAVKDILIGYVGKDNIITVDANFQQDDQFVLDNSKLMKYINIPFDKNSMFEHLNIYRQQLEKLKLEQTIFK